jgi:LysM repeat protein
MKNLILLFLVLTTIFSFGQDSACRHKVASGETLYAISRKYDTKPAELKKLNKGLTSSLSLDQEIIVPCNGNEPVAVVSTPVITSVEVVPATDEFNGNFIFHTIVKGETIYSLTNKFGVSETQLYNDNLDVKRDGLKVNGVVRLYQKDKTSEDEQLIDKHFLKVHSTGELNVFNPDLNKLDDSSFVNIAVMLPFQFERNVEFLKKFKDEQEPQLYNKTKIFLELYQGIKMAVDSAVESGLNVQLFVFDTKADTSEIRSIINQPVIKHMDLIIGPGFTNTFVFAANLLRNQSIPMISPFSKKEAVLKGNPFSVRIIPSEKSHFKAIGKYVSENLLDQNIIIAMQDSNDQTNANVIHRFIRYCDS